MFIDISHWGELFKKPDWYISIVPELEAIKAKARTVSEEEKEEAAEKIYSFFEQKLKGGEIVLGDEVGNWDIERKPIDTIVIHHTEADPRMTLDRLSAMTLARLYATYYARPHDARDAAISGKVISSGHVRDGRQIFWPYHWLVRMDGSVVQLLQDSEIGWHAGNWDINCRSIAIALDNNYLNSKPSEIVLKAVATIIKSHYSFVPKEQIYGHREVRLGEPTTCPSNLFLSSGGQKGWKEDLLDLV